MVSGSGDDGHVGVVTEVLLFLHMLSACTTPLLLFTSVMSGSGDEGHVGVVTEVLLFLHMLSACTTPLLLFYFRGV